MFIALFIVKLVVVTFCYMKKSVKKNIHEVTRIAEKMPRTLNEAIYEDFGDITEDEELQQEPLKHMPGNVSGTEQMPAQEPMQQPEQPSEPEAPIQDVPGAEGEAPVADAPVSGDMPEDKGEGDALNVEQFVDDIRKKSLRGMAQLAENPDDERYQLLKKIWQICDKKPEQQTAFSNPNAAMQPKKM